MDSRWKVSFFASANFFSIIVYSRIRVIIPLFSSIGCFKKRNDILYRFFFYLSKTLLKNFAWREAGITEINGTPQQIKKTFPLHLQNDALISRHEKLLIERQRNTGSLFSVLYQNGESLLSCPLECYLSTPFDWMIQSCSYTWKYLFLLWIEKRGIQSIFQKEDILAWLKHSQIRKEVVFFPFPLLEEEWKERAVWYFLKLLVQRRILAAISSEEWVVLKMVDRFQTEENKLRSLKQYAGPR